MGMFDRVNIKEPSDIIKDAIKGSKFEDIDLSEVGFQTKDIDDHPSLNTFELKNTNLFVEKYDLVTVPKEERSYPTADEKSPLAMMGAFQKKHLGWEQLKHVHRICRIYDKVENGWLELELKFTDGSLVACKLVEEK